MWLVLCCGPSNNLDAQTVRKNTALLYCCLHNKTECLKLLLRAKANTHISELPHTELTGAPIWLAVGSSLGPPLKDPPAVTPSIVSVVQFQCILSIECRGFSRPRLYVSQVTSM